MYEGWKVEYRPAPELTRAEVAPLSQEVLAEDETVFGEAISRQDCFSVSPYAAEY